MKKEAATNGEITLADGTRFVLSLIETAYCGDPTPAQIVQIEGHLSDETRLAAVRRCRIGDHAGFEVHYFLRAS